MEPVLDPRTPDQAHRAADGHAGALDVDLRPLETLLARIDTHCHPEQIWLFGSRARGDATAESDWDLLVVAPDDAADESLAPLAAWTLQKGSGVRADVLFCKSHEFRDDLGTVNTLANAVASEGILIRERSPADRQ